MRLTETSLRVETTGMNATSHTPLALAMTVKIEFGRDGEWAGLVIETNTPRPTTPVIVALKD